MGVFNISFSGALPILTTKQPKYLKSLFLADKKNMERMEERVPGVSYDPLQHFLSDCTWDWSPLNKQIGRGADLLLGDQRDSALLIDETGIPKKGKMSVGVARQWCGQQSKFLNCQIGDHHLGIHDMTTSLWRKEALLK